MSTNTSNADSSLPTSATIQIIDDNPQNLAALAAILTAQGYEVRTAISGALALQSTRTRLPDLILLDINMPGMDGYQVCERLKANERTRDVPVIFSSASDEAMGKVKAFFVGGVDHITKPFQEQEVLARVETHLALRKAQESLEQTNAQLRRANDALAHEIAERMQAENIKRDLVHALDERVKELDCLYGISKLVETPDISLEEMVEGIVALIPPAWQYSEVTCARITLEGQEFSTENFAVSSWQQTSDILVNGEPRGTVQVGYLEQRPQHDDGPFLKEERNLLDAIAKQLDKIIERMHAKEREHDQRQFLQTILDSVVYPLYVINVEDYSIAMANSATHKGRLSADVMCYALTHGNNQPCKEPGHFCPLQKVKETKAPVIVEHVHIDKAGNTRNVEVHAFPILDSKGNVVQMIEYALDITERKRVEESQRKALAAKEKALIEVLQATHALRESEARWRSLTAASPDYIFTLDTDLNVQFANFVSSELTVEELVGTPLYTLVEPERQAEIKSILEGVLNTGTPGRYETVYQTPDGDIVYFESHVTPRKLPDSDEIVGLTLNARDITERKQVEVQKEQLAVLEERERIGRELHDDLGQVIGYIGLEAQTARELLTRGQTDQAIATLTQLMQVANKAHDDVRQYILGIRTTSTSVTVNFFEELDQYLDQLYTRYGLKTHVSWPDGLARSPLSIEVETQLLRIIQEALTNIRKHAGVDSARIFSTLHPDEIQLVISDEGCGFSPPDIEGEGKGGHFGLNIMRERAEATGGSLQVHSEPGAGTQVVVRLPRVLEMPPETGIQGLRVLLVDDHQLYLEGLRNMLSVRGVQVVGMAYDGLQAHELARQYLPDLILMDVHMPHCDGLQATRRIKDDLPDVKIVMLTIAADDETLFQALKNGASGYLLKNIDERQFFTLLTEALRGETVLSPSLATKVLTTFTKWQYPAKSPPAVSASAASATAVSATAVSATAASATAASATAASAATSLPVSQAANNKAMLTPRQHQVLSSVAQGLTYKEVGAELHLTERTIKHYMGQILKTLQLENRRQAINYAWRTGLVE